ncbi:hypothetical protein KB681_gp62 [Burkholderia phage Mica]|uniref:Putative membrane protein n=1 Tax=Burkholderia phage Mica TaxID=2767579 RepID=A0A873WBP9_9CAUD|nr:hypothetical protein KB681_gp62 [Burkholderia phage Mica]QPB08650.1 putative membrane protein [Burkholderia phage Mica]
MKIAIVILAALVFAVIISMSFPSATIWQVALAPAAVCFAALAFNFRKGQ